MIPKFITFTEHPNEKYRSQSISCLNSFIITAPPSFSTNIDAFIQALFQRAADPSAEVRKAVCQALTLLLTARADKVVPELKNVADFMLYSCQDGDEAVALEACEFWLSFAEAEELKEHLRPFLPRVAPVLLNGMVYTEEDLIWLEGDEEDAAVPDRPEDIKPKFYGGTGHGFEHENVEGAGGPKKSRELGEDGEELDDDDDDYDEMSDDDEDIGSEWNLRKCSAAALDVMAVGFEAELLELLLPHLKEKLFSADWIQREAGILALGAMAEGELLLFLRYHERSRQSRSDLCGSLSSPRLPGRNRAPSAHSRSFSDQHP
jgi:transportin-1